MTQTLKTFEIIAHKYDEKRSPWRAYVVQAQDIDQAYREAYAAADSDGFLSEFRALEWLYRVTCREIVETVTGEAASETGVLRVERNVEPRTAIASKRRSPAKALVGAGV